MFIVISGNIDAVIALVVFLAYWEVVLLEVMKCWYHLHVSMEDGSQNSHMRSMAH